MCVGGIPKPNTQNNTFLTLKRYFENIKTWRLSWIANLLIFVFIFLCFVNEYICVCVVFCVKYINNIFLNLNFNRLIPKKKTKKKQKKKKHTH